MRSIIIPVLFLISSCSGGKMSSLQPPGNDQSHAFILQKGNLKAVFIDNTAMPPVHRANYNGIAELYHKDYDSTLFVPFYAGFNLEHIFNGDSLAEFYEPRVNPMVLYKRNDDEVLLYQKTTPISGVESITEFKMTAPDYIDITFRCILHKKEYLKNGYVGFFWASYINKPPDKSINFMGVNEGSQEETWINAFSSKHGTKSTHRHIKDTNDLFFAPDFKVTLANNFSDTRYTKPFYYGLYNNMMFALFFKSSEIIRFTQSPTGGGNNNPAWDFQYIIPDAKINKEYSFRVRMIYKPFISNEDVLQEFKRWK